MPDFEKIARFHGWIPLPGTGLFWRQRTKLERLTNIPVDNATSWEEACWIDRLHPDANPFKIPEIDHSFIEENS